MRRLAQLRIGKPATTPALRIPTISHLPASRSYSTSDGHGQNGDGDGDGKAAAAREAEAQAQAPQEQETQPVKSKVDWVKLDRKPFKFEFDGTWTGVNPTDKTIKTAVGYLPISPLMDPTFRGLWKFVTQKKKKPAPYNKTSDFQMRIMDNVYGKRSGPTERDREGC